MTRGIGVSLAIALCTSLSLAHAGERVLVVPPLRQGELDEGVEDQLEVRLHDVLRVSELELVVATNDLARRAAKCVHDSCRARLIATSGAEFMLVPEITLNDEDYHLRLTLYAASGDKVVQLEDTCSLCGLAEAADLLGDLGARMGRKIDVVMRVAIVEILSTPAGASVFVGSELVGTTPFQMPLAAGAHELRVRLDGYIGLRRSVEVVAGESLTLELELQRVPPKPALNRKLLAGLGYSALVVGAGTLIGGATLMGIDEQPVRSDCGGANIDVNGNCRWRHATLGGGVGVVAVGAVLLGTGVALLVMRRKRCSSPVVRVRPGVAALALEF